MLKHDEELMEQLYPKLTQECANRQFGVGEGRRFKKAKPKILKPQTEKVRTAELQADDDPKPKLYRVDWTAEDQSKGHRYVAAIDKTIALTLFDKKYGKDLDIANISVNRVPNEFWVRWPVMWDRIGIEIADTHKEQIRVAIEMEKVAHAKYKEWRKEWLLFWQTLGEAQTDDHKMWIELRKVKYEEWLGDWLEMWSDVGTTKWENRSRLDYLEIY
jgi:hypothetical protein